MITNMYTIFDAKVEAYQAPFWAANDAVAMRMIQSAMANGEGSLYLHAKDYELMCVGYFDDITGRITPETPTSVAQVEYVKDKMENPNLTSEGYIHKYGYNEPKLESADSRKANGDD